MEMWSAALEIPSNAPHLPLFVQLTTRKVMEGAMLIVFPKEERRDADSSQPVLKADDEQDVRYVAGYVALSLTKKYENTANDSTALKYLNCLGRMSENFWVQMDEVAYMICKVLGMSLPPPLSLVAFFAVPVFLLAMLKKFLRGMFKSYMT